MIAMGALWDHLEEFDAGIEVSAPHLHTVSLEVLGDPATKGKGEHEADRRSVIDASWREGYDVARAELEEELSTVRTETDQKLLEGQCNIAEEIEQLAIQLKASNEELELALAAKIKEICVPYMRQLVSQRCLEDFSGIIRTLLSDGSTTEISGPSASLDALREHLSGEALSRCTFVVTDDIEIVGRCNDSRVETCLQDWLDSLATGEQQDG